MDGCVLYEPGALDGTASVQYARYTVVADQCLCVEAMLTFWREQLSYLEHFFRLIKRYLAAVYLQDIYSNTNDNI